MTVPSDSTSFTAPSVDPREPEADLARSGLLLARFGPAVAGLAGLAPVDLVAIVADSRAAFGERLAAGTLLALTGDPRLDPMQPDMVDVPGGRFRMGLEIGRVDAVTAAWAPLGVERAWIAKEAPAHEVAVAPFRLGRHPVTNVEYLAFVVARPEAPRPSAWAHGVFPWAQANHPVYTVAPEAADAYAAWLAEVTGRRFRLPTEAEWEFAATGGDDREFPWGDDWDPERANTAERGPLCTTPVGIYPAGRSPFGLDDLAGNVEEYVADDYRPYPGGDAVADDLVDLHGASYRVARGGSFARHGDLARCRRRHGWYHSAHYAMGFRLAESL
jgi:formylglycine-generating enzyme required for sulfatase activity